MVWVGCFPYESVGSGLSLLWSIGYAKMVSMALEEMDDGRSVGILITGEVSGLTESCY